MSAAQTNFSFLIEKRSNGLARAGVIHTPHGQIETPAFAAVGTKATIKSLTPDQVKATGIQVVLANTYHLYLEPGADLVRRQGGLHQFMKWSGPIMTDSGGFQVFSLGAGFGAFGKRKSKVANDASFNISSHRDHDDILYSRAGKVKAVKNQKEEIRLLVKIDAAGVDFRSPKDGSVHRLTPEKSIEIQHLLGADIIFAFDECPSPAASYEYQREVVERTRDWAKRSLLSHKQFLGRGVSRQALFGIVQGGRYEDLRRRSARDIAQMDFDGFGIGGSFEKKDIETAVRFVNELLPEEKPRHLLGIGNPLDILGAIEAGVDTFDSVIPTREGRNGCLYTSRGRLNVTSAKFIGQQEAVEESCDCYTCQNFSLGYLSHLYRSGEMLAATLGTIHNLRFFVRFFSEARLAILAGQFERFRDHFSSLFVTRV
jgi:queuine tRNA-ribosyltransferase